MFACFGLFCSFVGVMKFACDLWLDVCGVCLLFLFLDCNWIC